MELQPSRFGASSLGAGISQQSYCHSSSQGLCARRRAKHMERTASHQILTQINPRAPL